MRVSCEVRWEHLVFDFGMFLKSMRDNDLGNEEIAYIHSCPGLRPSTGTFSILRVEVASASCRPRRSISRQGAAHIGKDRFPSVYRKETCVHVGVAHRKADR